MLPCCLAPGYDANFPLAVVPALLSTQNSNVHPGLPRALLEDGAIGPTDVPNDDTPAPDEVEDAAAANDAGPIVANERVSDERIHHLAWKLICLHKFRSKKTLKIRGLGAESWLKALEEYMVHAIWQKIKDAYNKYYDDLAQEGDRNSWY